MLSCLSASWIELFQSKWPSDQFFEPARYLMLCFTASNAPFAPTTLNYQRTRIMALENGGETMSAMLSNGCTAGQSRR